MPLGLALITMSGVASRIAVSRACAALRSFTFADLALERDHLFLQFVLCCLQRAILRLDLRQHLVERVGQPPPRRRRPS